MGTGPLAIVGGNATNTHFGAGLGTATVSAPRRPRRPTPWGTISAAGHPAVMRCQVTFQNGGLRVVPLGQRADRDLVLAQCPRLGAAPPLDLSSAAPVAKTPVAGCGTEREHLGTNHVRPHECAMAGKRPPRRAARGPSACRRGSSAPTRSAVARLGSRPGVRAPVRGRGRRTALVAQPPPAGGHAVPHRPLPRLGPPPLLRGPRRPTVWRQRHLPERGRSPVVRLDDSLNWRRISDARGLAAVRPTHGSHEVEFLRPRHP